MSHGVGAPFIEPVDRMSMPKAALSKVDSETGKHPTAWRLSEGEITAKLAFSSARARVAALKQTACTGIVKGSYKIQEGPGRSHQTSSKMKSEAPNPKPSTLNPKP